MPKYQLGDITCSAIPESGGKYRAGIRVAGNKLSPPSDSDYIYHSVELFEDCHLALLHAKAVANDKFGPE